MSCCSQASVNPPATLVSASVSLLGFYIASEAFFPQSLHPSTLHPKHYREALTLFSAKDMNVALASPDVVFEALKASWVFGFGSARNPVRAKACSTPSNQTFGS